MKVLKIERPEQYEILYEAAVTRQRGYNLQESRIIGKVLTVFEGMGRVKEERNGISLYTPVSVPIQIELEDTPFSLLYTAFSECVWSGTGARKASAIGDWLDELSKNG